MNESENRAALSAAWGVAAVVSASFAAVLYSIQGGGFPIWGFILTIGAAVTLYMCFATLRNWWPAFRRRSHKPEIEGAGEPEAERDMRRRRLGVGLGALIPDFGPLEIRLLDEDWDLWQGCAWIAALKVQLTNHTKEPIRLARFHLESDPGKEPRPKLAQVQIQGIFNELLRRRESLSCIKAVELHPNDSATGWWVHEAYLPYPDRAGRPRCLFMVTDTLGNMYELEIPARPPKTW